MSSSLKHSIYISLSLFHLDSVPRSGVGGGSRESESRSDARPLRGQRIQHQKQRTQRSGSFNAICCRGNRQTKGNLCCASFVYVEARLTIPWLVITIDLSPVILGKYCFENYRMPQYF